MAELGRAGLDVTTRWTRSAGDATALAAASADESDVVFALGGDGTTREVAAGLLGKATPISILPGGTTNVLPRELGLGTDALEVARSWTAAQGSFSTRSLDVGLVDERPFLMMVSVGFDAVVLTSVPPPLKARFGRLGIAAAALWQWLLLSTPSYEVAGDGERGRSTRLGIVCNIRRYAGSFIAAPTADPSDGELDLVASKSGGRWQLLRFALGILGTPGFERPPSARVSRVTFRAPDGSALAIQIDGDAFEVASPARVSVHPERLKVLLPRKL